MKSLKIGAAVLAGGLGAQAHGASVYTDEASFLGNVGAGYSFNAFDDVVGGLASSLSYSLNGFAYDITAVGSNSDLFNDVGLVSTNVASDAILVTFTSGNVTAVGGNFWSSDIWVEPLQATVVITLSDGTVIDFESTGASDFRGFTSDTLITSIQIDAVDGFDVAWSTMDNLYVGVAVVPLPPAAWAGLGLLGAIGGVRAVRRRG
jgi:hypothetical protein